jgi:hypothetical protein
MIYIKGLYLLKTQKGLFSLFIDPNDIFKWLEKTLYIYRLGDAVAMRRGAPPPLHRLLITHGRMGDRVQSLCISLGAKLNIKSDREMRRSAGLDLQM